MAGLAELAIIIELALISWLLYVLYKVRRVSGHFVDWDWVMLGFILMWLRFALSFAAPKLPKAMMAVTEWAEPIVSLLVLACFIVGFEKIGSHFIRYGRK